MPKKRDMMYMQYTETDAEMCNLFGWDMPPMEGGCTFDYRKYRRWRRQGYAVIPIRTRKVPYSIRKNLMEKHLCRIDDEYIQKD